MQLRVEVSGAKNLIRLLDGDAKQVRYATAVALTRTAFDARSAEQSEMRRVFDRPTPFTINSLYVKPATRASLWAEVFFKDVGAARGTTAGQYLIPQVEGGERKQKRSERAMQLRLHGRTIWVVPSDDVMDQFGNVPRGMMTRILSALRANPDALQNRPRGRSGRRSRKAGLSYFIAGNVILERKGSSVRAVMAIVRTPRYTQRFKFYEISKRVVAQRFDAQFERAFAEAMRTRR